MDKTIWKSIGKWSYFLGNVLVGLRVVFLSNCPLVLSLHKHRGVGIFLNKKKWGSQTGEAPYIIVYM